MAADTEVVPKGQAIPDHMTSVVGSGTGFGGFGHRSRTPVPSGRFVCPSAARALDPGPVDLLRRPQVMDGLESLRGKAGDRAHEPPVLAAHRCRRWTRRGTGGVAFEGDLERYVE